MCMFPEHTLVVNRLQIKKPLGRTLLLGICIFSLILPPLTSAQPEKLILAPTENGKIQVPLYKSGLIRLKKSAKRISVGNPGIADIVILRSRQVHVVGKALGTTNVVLWDSQDNIFATFEVEVIHDLETLKKKLHELLPGEKIKVHSAQERIILSGEVSNVVKMNAAKELAFAFLPECVSSDSNVVIRDTTKGPPIVLQQGSGSRGSGSTECKEGSVVNLMQSGGAQQVMLEVKVAEIARTLLRKLNAQLKIFGFGDTTGGVITGGGSFPPALTPDGLQVPIFGNLNGNNSPIGPPVELFTPNTPTIDDSGYLLSHLTGDFLFQAVIEASRRKGLAQVLAEPTLTTLTGQPAEFLSGGEFPVPVPQDFGRTTIQFKEFGVGLKFVPVVLDSGRINLKINIVVSEISEDNTVRLAVADAASVFVIPSLTRRSASSTVELADGQTIGIAGLINENTRQSLQKLPGLGDLPVLGALFRSQEWLSGQTELVIFVTPHLARPIVPQQVRLPTDTFVPPNDWEFYLMGRMESRNAPRTKRFAPSTATGGTESGKFGHQL
jgi:pilus assembly protein CpaC